MFSPYYRASGRRDPLDHAALNVALYGPGRGRWTMSERGLHQVARSAERLAIGPSAMAWDGDALTIAIDEVGAPLPERVRGIVRVSPRALGDEAFALDPGGRHLWRPVAPCARVEVAFDKPALRWAGEGYLDANQGVEALEAGFRHWDWSRAHLGGGETAVLYEGTRADRSRFGLALRIGADGAAREVEPPPAVRLPSTRVWRMPRATRADGGARVVKTWEDSPFYARSALATRLFGEPAAAVHESLSLTRFASPLVQALLPFRMPRVLS